MWEITIDSAKCEGEGDCGSVCPVNILGVEPFDGKQISVVTGSAEDCIGCMACVNECKQGAIDVAEV